MKSSEACFKAAKHISEYGHYKGRNHKDSSNPQTSPSCVFGALQVVTEDYWGNCYLDRRWEECVDGLRDYTGSTFVAVEWNDHPDRTAEEVILALRYVGTRLELEGL